MPPFPQERRPVEDGIQLSRAARRRLKVTGAVHPSVPNLEELAGTAAVQLWES